MSVDDAEAGLIEAIQAAPGDDDARLVYADWLEENDELSKAEYVRLEIALLNAGYEVTPSSEVEAQRARFETISRTLDPEWRAAMSRVSKQPRSEPRVEVTVKRRVRVPTATPAQPRPPIPPTAAEVEAARRAGIVLELPTADGWRDDSTPKAPGGDSGGERRKASDAKGQLTLGLGILIGFILIGIEKSGCSCSNLETPRNRPSDSAPSYK